MILVSGIFIFSAFSKAEDLLSVKSVECVSDVQRAAPGMIQANLERVTGCLCLNGVLLCTSVIDTQGCSLVGNEWGSNVLCFVCL